jgi:hypothetical protein
MHLAWWPRPSADELCAVAWTPKRPELLENAVVLLPGEKDMLSILFQLIVWLHGEVRFQPSVAMRRHPAMTRSGCVDFVTADVGSHDDLRIADEGLASIRKVIRDADVILENRKRFNQAYPPV